MGSYFTPFITPTDGLNLAGAPFWPANTTGRLTERIAAIIEPWQHAERLQFADLIDRFTAGYEANWCDRPDLTKASIRAQDQVSAHR